MVKKYRLRLAYFALNAEGAGIPLDRGVPMFHY